MERAGVFLTDPGSIEELTTFLGLPFGTHRDAADRLAPSLSIDCQRVQLFWITHVFV
jgi:hypothetical protein